MRKLIISLLLISTAAMPALAQDGERERDRGQSAQSSDEDRAARRAARAERVEARRAERAANPQRAERPERAERAERRQHVERVSEQAVVETEAPRRLRVARPADNDVQRTETRSGRGDDNSLARQLLARRNAVRDGTAGVVPDRDGDRDWSRDGDRRDETRRSRDGDRRWSSHWRSDRRYDWRRHRDRNRSIFRFGSYYDPYRYGYRRFSIGFNLWPSYYSSRFWLNDPWQYRLPPAYGPYRWVRYYDDALLVNIYTGQVVDVIHSFFW